MFFYVWLIKLIELNKLIKLKKGILVTLSTLLTALKPCD